MLPDLPFCVQGLGPPLPDFPGSAALLPVSLPLAPVESAGLSLTALPAFYNIFFPALFILMEVAVWSVAVTSAPSWTM